MFRPWLRRLFGEKRDVRILRSLAFRPALETLEDRTAPALVAAYAFGEGAGLNTADASGTGNTGAILNATWNASGKYGSALSFNGTNARIDVADAASLDLTSGMTLEAWVNPAVSVTGWRDILYKGNDNYYLEASSTNGGRPAVGVIAGGVYGEAYGSAALPINTWTHLAATYDGTAVKLFVNGTQVASTARTGLIQTSTSPLQIGGDSLYGQYFQGLIDEVRIYNHALSLAEIVQDMNTAIGGSSPTV